MPKACLKSPLTFPSLSASMDAKGAVMEAPLILNYILKYYLTNAQLLFCLVSFAFQWGALLDTDRIYALQFKKLEIKKNK